MLRFALFTLPFLSLYSLSFAAAGSVSPAVYSQEYHFNKRKIEGMIAAAKQQEYIILRAFLKTRTDALTNTQKQDYYRWIDQHFAARLEEELHNLQKIDRAFSRCLSVTNVLRNNLNSANQALWQKQREEMFIAKKVCSLESYTIYMDQVVDFLGQSVEAVCSRLSAEEGLPTEELNTILLSGLETESECSQVAKAHLQSLQEHKAVLAELSIATTAQSNALRDFRAVWPDLASDANVQELITQEKKERMAQLAEELSRELRYFNPDGKGIFVYYLENPAERPALSNKRNHLTSVEIRNLRVSEKRLQLAKPLTKQ